MQIVSFKFQSVYIQYKSPLLSIEQGDGWVAEPVRGTGGGGYIYIYFHLHLPDPEVEWFLCYIASILDAILITGSQLSMICNFSHNNSFTK